MKTFLFALIAFLPLIAQAEFPAWDKMSTADRWSTLQEVSRLSPMNWGEGGGGIDYGGAERREQGEPRERKQQDAAAPSSGYCLGVSVYRYGAFQEIVEGKPVTPTTRPEIAKRHESAGGYEYKLIQEWMKKTGESSYDKALAAHAASVAEVIKYAQKYPGAWVGLKSKSIHHAVQAFEVGGKLILVDPNVPDPMIGDYTANGEFVWKTANGRLSSVVDFIYLPAFTWKP